jgi:hypothetical protein
VGGFGGLNLNRDIASPATTPKPTAIASATGEHRFNSSLIVRLPAS